MPLELIARLRTHAASRPDAPALRDRDADDRIRICTYAELLERAEVVADRLRQEFPPGSVVLVCYFNQPEYVFAFCGALLAGATVFPVHPASTPADLRTAARDARAAALIGVESARAALADMGIRWIEPATEKRHRQDDSAVEFSDSAQLLLQSSGTTGPPHIVLRSGRALDAVARNVVQAVDLTADDNVLALIPMCHSYGVENALLAPLHAGACLTLCRTFDAARFVQRIREDRVTVFPGVPTMFELLAQQPCDEPLPLRCAYAAGANLPPGVVEGFRNRFGVPVGQLYGMTEIGSVTFNDPAAANFDATNVGLPLEGVRVRIVDPETRDLARPLPPDAEGEVAVSAPSMLAGYIDPNTGECETPPDLCEGFLFTGDLGRVDNRGRLSITGRKKLVVDIAGQKVNLVEVEQAIAAYPGVRVCAVAAVAVTQTVYRLKAAVVAETGVAANFLEGLRVHLRETLAPHKVPRLIELREDLPRSPTGKVLRHRL